MKPLLRCILFLLCAAPALADDIGPKLPAPFGPLHIVEVGLNGEFTSDAPVGVRLQVANPLPTPQSLDLVLHAGVNYVRQMNWQKDTFVQPLTLAPGEQRELEVPAVLTATNDLVLEAALVDSAGRAVAYDWTTGASMKVRQFTGAVVLLCAAEPACKAAQQQAQFSGSEENHVYKNKNLHFIVLRQPRAHWWSYAGVNTVVIAEPMAGYSAGEKAALEAFLRQGGKLIVVEQEIGDPTFLAEYRQGGAGPEAIPVSQGKLFRVASLGGDEFGNLFTGTTLAVVVPDAPRSNYSPGWAGALGWFGRHAATQFYFPRLRWLLLWLGVYIIVIGVVNFAILRRLRKLEWGWLTVGLGALLFAAGFFISGSWHRPREFTLDDLAVYWLDARSGQASASYGLRVSAPLRRDLVLSLSDDAVLASGLRRHNPEVNIGAAMREENVPGRPGVELRLGPPRQVPVALLRWSFSDFEFTGMRRFPGTVHEVAPGRLRNDTGVNFSDAVVVSPGDESMWPLGALSSGAEATLSEAGEKPMYESEQQRRELAAQLMKRGRPLSLPDLARSGNLPVFKRVLLAVADGPAPAAELSGTRFVRRNRALFVVVLQ